MKRILVYTTFLLAIGFGLKAQTKLPGIDKSPLDLSYFPVNYPVLRAQDKASDKPLARVLYSRPSMNGRKIFGELVEYGKVWRLGANESTEIEFYADAIINKTKIKKGRYTLYAIPTTNSWTLIMNKELNTWGAFNYHSDKDLFRVEVPVTKRTDTVEALTIYFEGNADASSCILNAVWEDTMISLPILFSVKK